MHTMASEIRKAQNKEGYQRDHLPTVSTRLSNDYAIDIQERHRRRNLSLRDHASKILQSSDRNQILQCVINDIAMLMPAGMLKMFPHCLHPAEKYLLRFYIETRHFQEVCNLMKPGDFVVDVGASGGIFTIMASRTVGAAGRVVAFEPANTAFEYLQLATNHNNLLNVRLEKAAVSNSSGSVGFVEYPFDPEGLSWMPEVSSIATEENSGRDVTRYMVRSINLDDYLDRAPRVIKIDVEGYEIQVIEGSIQIIQKYKPILCIDIHKNPFEEGMTDNAIVPILEDLGYSFQKIDHVLIAKG